MLKMNRVLYFLTKMVNFIRVEELNYTQFVALLEQREAKHGDMSYHAAVRWLSLG